MKRIIDGVRYDTDHANTFRIADLSPDGYGRGDFEWEETALYRAGGDWFLAGEGGPRSRWAQPYGRSGWTGGEGIQPVTQGEALHLLEQAGTAAATAAIEEYFGAAVRDAGETRGPGR